MIKLGPIQAEDPVSFGRQKQLLVDNSILSDWWKITRVQEPVRKHPENPILEGDQIWECDKKGVSKITPSSALYDEESGLYKLWYHADSELTRSSIHYAESEDGIHWRKPELGLVELGGTLRNNVCRVEPGGTYLKGLFIVQNPPERPPEGRFKAIGVAPIHEDGTYVGWCGSAVSDDGKTWRTLDLGADGGTREGGGGGNPSCVWDEEIQRYVLFQRQLTETAVPGAGSRHITRQESVDLIHWSPRETVFNPMGSRWPETESMMTFFHEGIYFGLPQMLENEITGNVETHLVTSRDGFHWDHPFADEAFIPRGASDQFDYKETWFAQAVIHGDECKFYYGGSRSPHSPGGPPIVDDGGSRNPWDTPYTIGLATVPLDRLMGLRVDEPTGGFLTRPFIVEGEQLYINAVIDRELRVEVVDPVVELYDHGPKGTVGHYVGVNEKCLPGFTLQDCQAVTGDSLAHCVKWKGGPIGKLKGRSVRLRVLGRQALIYAFQIE